MNLKRKSRPATEWVKETPGIVAVWGPHPFGPPDEVDGTRVDGILLRRTPDGGLVGIVESQEPNR